MLGPDEMNDLISRYNLPEVPDDDVGTKEMLEAGPFLCPMCAPDGMMGTVTASSQTMAIAGYVVRDSHKYPVYECGGGHRTALVLVER